MIALELQAWRTTNTGHLWGVLVLGARGGFVLGLLSSHFCVTQNTYRLS